MSSALTFKKLKHHFGCVQNQSDALIFQSYAFILIMEASQLSYVKPHAEYSVLIYLINQCGRRSIYQNIIWEETNFGAMEVQ